MNIPKYTLPDLPYGYADLQPAISEEIMTLHHDKHHKGYVDKANTAIEALSKDPNLKHNLRDLSFNLNGHILHTKFWTTMKPYQKDNNPNDNTKKMLASRFGNFDNFKQQFTDAAKSVEGSGWMTLLRDSDENLNLMQIENHNKLYLAENSIVMLIDMWEHAYYLDYQNDRSKYLENWWNVVNWEEIEKRLSM
jgi:Fe-Mn family superoxide dismutase